MQSKLPEYKLVIHAIEVGRVMFVSEQIIRIVLYVIILWSYEVYDRVICY